MKITDRIKDFVENELSGSDKFLVETETKSGNRITLFIDGDNGVTIEDCRQLTRTIRDQFDEEMADVELTVSSPGIDQPIRMNRQYRKNLGRTLSLTLMDDSRVDGILTDVRDLDIVLEHPVKNNKELKKPDSVIPFPEIRKAEITIKFGK